MDSEPTVFANKVIQRLVEQIVPGGILVTPDDYKAIRAVFRRCGGRWADFGVGDQVPIELLKTIIRAWGEMPERRRKSDV